MEEYLYKMKNIADYHIESFLINGHAPNGCNGPYKNCDTPIRNTAHWAVSYALLYKIFNEKKYEEIVECFSHYLYNSKNYGINGAAICRKNAMDDTNGVIGQAWVIEGLLACYDITRDERLLNKAVSVFESQELIESTGLWKICCSNGCNVGYDYVYNHNLWFAAAGSQILERKENDSIRKKVENFLNHSRDTYGVQPSGCLYHLINSNVSPVENFKYVVKKTLTDWNFPKFKEMNYLEKGYHLFDLYGFAILKKQFSNHPELNSRKLKKAILYGIDERFLHSLGEIGGNLNKYSYPYNSPAFEYPFVSSIFTGTYDEKMAKKMLNIQFTELFDDKSMIFSKKNEDPVTLTARMYEILRFFSERI